MASGVIVQHSERPESILDASGPEWACSSIIWNDTAERGRGSFPRCQPDRNAVTIRNPAFLKIPIAQDFLKPFRGVIYPFSVRGGRKAEAGAEELRFLRRGRAHAFIKEKSF